jgi:nitroreductase
MPPHGPPGTNRLEQPGLAVRHRRGRGKDIYKSNFSIYAKNPRSAQYEDGDLRAEQRDKITESATFLTENFHRVPLMLVPCITGRLDNASVFQGASAWGSILPAVWSFMMALRERGMGSAWTTIHLIGDGEKQAAEVLGIPYDTVSQAGLFPIAYTVGTDFKVAKRLPLDTVMHWDTWGSR